MTLLLGLLSTIHLFAAAVLTGVAISQRSALDVAIGLVFIAIFFVGTLYFMTTYGAERLDLDHPRL